MQYYRARKRDLHMVFIDLNMTIYQEKYFVGQWQRWTLKKYINIVQDMLCYSDPLFHRLGVRYGRYGYRCRTRADTPDAHGYFTLSFFRHWSFKVFLLFRNGFIFCFRNKEEWVEGRQTLKHVKIWSLNNYKERNKEMN